LAGRIAIVLLSWGSSSRKDRSRRSSRRRSWWSCLYGLEDPFQSSDDAEREDIYICDEEEEEKCGGFIDDEQGEGVSPEEAVKEDAVDTDDAGYHHHSSGGEREDNDKQEEEASGDQIDEEVSEDSTIEVEGGFDTDEEDDDDDERSGDDIDAHYADLYRDSSDDEDNVVSAGEVSLALAALLMRDVVRLPRYRYRRITVNLSRPSRSANDETALRGYREQYAACFGVFTTALGTYRGVRHLELCEGNFWLDENDEGPRSDSNHDDDDDDDASGGTGPDVTMKANGPDLERLFGSVLPDHGSLNEITFENCRIQTAYWRLFTESIPATNDYYRCYWKLKRLTVDDTPLNMEGCLLLKSMLQRGVMLDELVVERCEMAADG
jgi:hypothetical protein